MYSMKIYVIIKKIPGLLEECNKLRTAILQYQQWNRVEQNSSVGFATRYGLDGPGIESQ
jgi:hypothetical protein